MKHAHHVGHLDHHHSASARGTFVAVCLLLSVGLIGIAATTMSTNAPQTAVSAEITPGAVSGTAPGSQAPAEVSTSSPAPAPPPKFTVSASAEAKHRQVKEPISHLVFHPDDRASYLEPAGHRVTKPDKGWPCLVFLHGAGEVGTDLYYLYRALGATGALPQLASLTTVGAARQSPDDPYRWSVAEAHLRGYVVVAPLSDRSWGDQGNCDAVVELVRLLPSQLGVDPSLIFLTGVSQGGYGTFRIAAQAPTLFAGAIPLCGFGEASWASRYADSKLPLLVVHGVNDDIVPFSESVKMFQACQKAKVPDVTLWKLDPSADPLDNPGNGHAAWRNTYSDPQFWTWLSNHSTRR